MSKESKFWNWFKTNNSSYFYLNQLTDNSKKESLLNEFLENLHEYSDGLFFELGGYPNGTQELIISAEGNKEYFKAAEKLVAKAPKIDEWEFICLKPPMGVDFITKYEDIELDPKTMWFLPLTNSSNPKILGLRVYSPNYHSSKNKVYLNAVNQVLDTILGEKSRALDVHHLEVGKVPPNPEDEGLIELVELKEYINWKKSKT